MVLIYFITMSQHALKNDEDETSGEFLELKNKEVNS